LADDDTTSWGDDIIDAGDRPAAPLLPLPPFPARPAPDAGPSWSWRSLGITAGVLVVLGLGAFWYLTRDTPVAIEVDGRPVANAETVLDRAEAAFADLVRTDGATPADDAACWFTPPPDDQPFAGRGPQLACGPVLLGVSGTTEPWVLGRVDYSAGVGGDEVTGSFDSLVGVGAPDTGDFARPDGRGAPGTSGLAPATAGIRTEDGRRLIGDQAVIDAADEVFADAADEAGASVTDGSSCFFGGTRNRAGQFRTDGDIWCGPVLLRTSDPADRWARTTVSFAPGDTFALAKVARAPNLPLTGTVGLEAGTDLARPDRREPADGDDLEPPDAEPVDAGSVEVVDELPDDVDLDEPDDGRLVTPSRNLRLTGIARVDKVGSGADALVAGTGSELVVAAFEVARVEGASYDAGTAQMVVDGDRTPFAGWPTIDGSGAIVASVPDDAGQVTLEVLFDGVAQQLSLLTGERVGAFPAALYREDATVGLGRQLDATAALPAGEPVTAGGVVSEAALAAWTEEQGWAPEGRAFLALTVDGWTKDTPCCDVTGVEVTPLFSVTTASGERIDGTVGDASSRPEPVFVVPADFTSGIVELRLRVTFHRGSGEQETVEGAPAGLPVELPG
jgi:hypothetical protein